MKRRILLLTVFVAALLGTASLAAAATRSLSDGTPGQPGAISMKVVIKNGKVTEVKDVRATDHYLCTNIASSEVTLTVNLGAFKAAIINGHPYFHGTRVIDGRRWEVGANLTNSGAKAVGSFSISGSQTGPEGEPEACNGGFHNFVAK